MAIKIARLVPTGFFLWGYVKNKVYCSQHVSLDELKRRIRTAIANVLEAMLIRAV